MRIGVVACGYADGYPRIAPNGTPVLVDGVRTALVGRVSMDMVTVDLTPVPAAVVGSIIAVPFAVVLGVAAALGGDSETTSVGFIVALTLGTLLSSLITLPFATGVSSLLYIDTRMRREGLDIALAAAASTPAPAPNEATGGKGW